MNKINSALQQARKNKQTVVLATGVFDVLHLEHTIFLKNAKKIGDILLAGVETDLRVRVLKGEGRPINNQKLRVSNLEKLKLADGVFILPKKFEKKEDYLKLLHDIKPDYLAVSSHTPYLEKKKKLMKKVGGELVVVHQHNPEFSTTKLVS